MCMTLTSCSHNVRPVTVVSCHRAARHAITTFRTGLAGGHHPVVLARDVAPCAQLVGAGSAEPERLAASSVAWACALADS